MGRRVRLNRSLEALRLNVRVRSVVGGRSRAPARGRGSGRVWEGLFFLQEVALSVPASFSAKGSRPADKPVCIADELADELAGWLAEEVPSRSFWLSSASRCCPSTFSQFR